MSQDISFLWYNGGIVYLYVVFMIHVRSSFDSDPPFVRLPQMTSEAFCDCLSGSGQETCRHWGKCL